MNQNQNLIWSIKKEEISLRQKVKKLIFTIVLNLPLFSIFAHFVNLLVVLKDARHYKDQFLTKPNKLLYTSLSDEMTVGWTISMTMLGVDHAIWIGAAREIGKNYPFQHQLHQLPGLSSEKSYAFAAFKVTNHISPNSIVSLRPDSNWEFNSTCY